MKITSNKKESRCKECGVAIYQALGKQVESLYSQAQKEFFRIKEEEKEKDHIKLWVRVSDLRDHHIGELIHLFSIHPDIEEDALSLCKKVSKGIGIDAKYLIENYELYKREWKSI